MSKRLSIISLLMALVFALPLSMRGENPEHAENDGEVDVKELIFEHLGDGYGWEVPFSHTERIPLPVIVRAQDGHWFCFSSADLTKTVSEQGSDGKVHKHLVPVVKTIEKDGKTYEFELAVEGDHKDKVVQLIDGEEYRPWDLSITKNVAALFIAALIVLICVLSLARYYKRTPLRAPHKGMGFLELCVSFVYYDTIKATLGDEEAPRFAPYLLTCFFFILIMNLVGLIVIFPGGANLTGNIAVTMVLAIMTFIVTNIFGTKHYWKEIFWPEVPLFLKFPLPIMQVIEVFGIFTKPAALCVRLFANMMGGHIIVITLTLLIFIFAAFGTAVTGTATVISVLFSVFMLVLDVLVSFIQAYVFTTLSTLFISMARVKEHEHEEKHSANPGYEEHEKELVAEEEAGLQRAAAAVDMK